MKQYWIIIFAICLTLTACGTNINDASTSSPSSSPIVIESQSPGSDVPSIPEIDEKIESTIVSVLSDHVKAIQAKDENLIQTTVVPTIAMDERAYMLWNANAEPVYEIAKMSLQSADDKTAVVNVSFTNGEFYSFALTNSKEGWKLYDID